jgi:hypothetical protein
MNMNELNHSVAYSVQAVNAEYSVQPVEYKVTVLDSDVIIFEEVDEIQITL